MGAWKTARLSELCQFQRGLTYAKADEVAAPGHTVLRANNIDLASSELDFSELKFISSDVMVSDSKYVRKGNLLICTASGSKSHLGKVAYIDKDYGYAFGGFMGQITPNASLDGRYLFYTLISPAYKLFIEKLSDGININNLKFDNLGQFSVPVPAPDEQRRIVAILDEAFDAIATAKANTEKNLKDARAVFEVYLQEVFLQRGEDWVETTIGTATKFIDYRGKTPPKTESGIRLITAKNIKMGYIQEIPREFIASDEYQTWMTRGIPKKGDVLFTTEAPLANVAQLDTNEKVAFAQRVIIMQPDEKRLDNSFLKYLLLSPPMQKRIREKGTGATVQGIKASLLKKIEIWFPEKLNKQAKIVTRLDALNEQTQALESLYRCKLAALDELKKSLLHQAFTGQLTAQAADRQLAAVA